MPLPVGTRWFTFPTPKPLERDKTACERDKIEATGRFVRIFEVRRVARRFLLFLQESKLQKTVVSVFVRFVLIPARIEQVKQEPEKEKKENNFDPPDYKSQGV